jgi:hypothetical protein
MKSVPVCALAAAVITGSVGQCAAQGPITVEFMAAKPSWTNHEFVGHAFLCVRIPTRQGIKEDCFGFYSKDGVGVIAGPGKVVSEFERNPSRFSRITVSVTKAISPEQRGRLYQVIRDWNAQHYQFMDPNCIDFVVAAATAIGMHAAPRADTQLPEVYLRKLKDANR